MTRALCLLLALPAVASAASLSQIEEEHLLRRTYETPHVDWGKPWAKGPIKALIFSVGSYGDVGRDPVEMLERFDLQLTAVYMESNRKVVHFTNSNADVEAKENPPDSDGVQRLRRLLLQKWDLFIFGNINPDVLPAELQYYIYKQVAEGAGLLVIGARPTKVMLDRQEMADPPGLFPLAVSFWELPTAQAWVGKDEKPESLERKLVHAYKLGKGRGVNLAIPGARTLTPKTPATPENINELEYWFALAGELSVWAAGRDVDPGDAAFAGKPYRQRLRLVRLDGWAGPWMEKTGTLKPDEDMRAKLPKLPSGLYVWEVTLDVDGKRIWFGAKAVIDTEEPQAVAEIKLARDFCEPGEPMGGTVELAEADYSGCRLRMETRDSWGRVLARKDYPVQAGTRQVEFSLPTDENCSIYMRAEASLWKGEQQLTAPKAADFRVTQRRRGIFHQVMWDSADSAIGYWAMLKLRQCGFDVDLRWGTSQSVAMADMPLIPYTTRIMESLDAKGIMQPCCWNDLEAVKRWMDEIAKPMEVQRKHGAMVYSLGDETTTQGVCLSPQCMAAYRKYLQAQYGDIAALNKSWGADYKTFDEVELSKPEDNYEKTAMQAGNFARWYDRQAFSQYNYLQINARFGQRYLQLDPQALTGFEGAGGFGDDIQGIVETNGFWNPYPSLGDEVLNSMAPRGYLRANWIGYQRTAEPLNYWYWRMIVNGCSAMFWWRWDGTGLFHGYLAPDYEPYAATADLTRDSEVVRQGLGDLMMHADKADDGIAVFYSVAAAQVDKLAGMNLGGVQRAHEAWVNLTRATGYGPRYVTERDIEGGALAKSYKVLVLPATRAISDKAAEAIRSFVLAGGAVVADLRPGDFTGHLAKRQTPALQDLFGVKFGPEPKIEATKLELKAAGDAKVALSWDKIGVDTAVEAAGAQGVMAGKTPVMLMNKAGRGTAVLLNFSVGDLNAAEMEAGGRDARKLVASLYATLGVKPVARLVSDDPKVVLHSGSWRTGRLTIYAAQMRNTVYDGGRYTLSLAEPMHVYDLRDAKYLGKRDKVEFPAARTRFMILSPAALKPVRASLKLERGAGGERVTITVRKGEGNPDGLYAAAVRLYDPAGAEQIWARRNVVVKAAEAVSLPLGLRAAGGKWRATVRDLATGAETALAFEVAGGEPAIWPGVYRARK
jgi:hypothetical protein